MAGLKGKSGPPGNMNAFKHGLAAIQNRREQGCSHRGICLIRTRNQTYGPLA